MFSDARKQLGTLALAFFFLLLAGCTHDGEAPAVVAPPPSVQEEGSFSVSAERGVSLDMVEGSDSPVPAKEELLDDPADAADIRIEAAEAAPVIEFTLVYLADEGGSISGAVRQSVEEGKGGSAVTAVPTIGYHFVSWSDGAASNPRTDTNVTADLAVTASFAVNEYTLSYSAPENGSIEGDRRQKVKHGESGSSVRAVPAPNHHFVRWSDGSTVNPRTDAQVVGDISITALFALDQYALTYSAGEYGSIEGVAQQRVEHGKMGSPVRAIPAKGYRFVGWSDGSAANPRTERNVTADLTVSAEFAPNEYTVSYGVEGRGSIDGADRQIVRHGGDGTPVTAMPQRGYHFVRWSDGADTARRIDREVASDIDVRAEFAVNTYTVGGRVSGLVEGTSVVLQNSGDELIVTAAGEFVFETALLADTPYAVAVLKQPSSPNQTCTVIWGEGRIADADVDDIVVECVLKTYTVGGAVFGLPEGSELVLQNKGKEELVVTVSGDFTFARALEDGSPYEVVIARQRLRSNWLCTLENAAGRVTGTDVSDIDIACFPELVLQARPGIRTIDLSWNRDDFPGARFNLCRARDDLSGVGFESCTDVRGGRLERGVEMPHSATGLFNDVAYWLQMEVETAEGRRTVSKAVKAMPFGGLNDTGIDWCADQGGNRNMGGTRTEKEEGCEVLAATFPGQDAHRGRDAMARARILTKTGSGSAGFDFTKICMSGETAGEGRCPPNPLPGNGANNWACIRDNVTGLLWEVKATEGLRSRDHTYTWHHPDKAINGGNPGQWNGGSCRESDCDTHGFVQAVNALGLCGVDDWRLPTRKELLSIVDNSRFEPAIDTNLFPQALSARYWTSSPYADQEGSAWHVYFQYGEVYPDSKSQSHHVRLVRGRTATFGLDNP